MTLKFVKSNSGECGASKRQSGHVQPRALLISLDQPGRVRIAEWLGMLGIKHATFYTRRWQEILPKPDGHDPRPFWNTETVRAFLDIRHERQSPRPKRAARTPQSPPELFLPIAHLIPQGFPLKGPTE